MVYAQIKNGKIANTIILADLTLANLFLAGFDEIIRIDEITPRPGVGWLFDGLNFLPVAPVQESVQKQINKKIRAAMEFGEDLMVEFATENVMMGMTTAQIKSLSELLADVRSHIMSGSLYTALNEMDLVTPDANITAERLLIYKNKIRGYLGLVPL